MENRPKEQNKDLIANHSFTNKKLNLKMAIPFSHKPECSYR